MTSRQAREKLQCLYANVMSNNFRKTHVLKKKEGIINQSYSAKDSTNKFTCTLKISSGACFSFSNYLPDCNLSGKF